MEYLPLLALFVHLGFIAYWNPYNKKFSERYSATEEEAEWTEKMRLFEKEERLNGQQQIKKTLTLLDLTKNNCQQ